MFPIRCAVVGMIPGYADAARDIFGGRSHVSVRMVLLALAAYLVLSSLGDSCQAGNVLLTTRGRVVYSDLVIRGVIRGYDTELVTYDNYVPASRHPKGPFPITNVIIDVREVLTGAWDEASITVVVPGGYPDEWEGRRTVSVRIHTDGYGYGYNYSAGDEVILSLRYSPLMKGGAFIVVTDEGRFLKKGEKWENQGTKERFSIEQIREVAREAKLEVVVRKAGLVGVGTVDRVSVDRSRPALEIEEIAIRVSRIWKGRLGGERVTFRLVRRGGDQLWWKRPVPALSVGEVWLFCLQREENDFYMLSGTNGLFQIEGDKVLRNNALAHRLSKKEIEDLIREASAR